ncbi:hypothetical protein M4951_00330 [Blastopirellula sp. J2-11]|uniref:hypothetical protein n=1 Tax=Blastopirellula sp. J2-11 TaxID=2943192 RepID=UPI0021C5BB12|nr:hypothetical protein [Blastopirellula sp. J2-11]UUO06773.1 hypothetical protein M4951_00330 [Blastopirellula sp. J2-11]
MKHSATRSRRQFLSAAAISGIGFFQNNLAWSGEKTPHSVAQPYARIDWEHSRQIGSVSHAHCRSQVSLDLLCRRQLKHLAISNYYPSVPCRPDERSRQYEVSQDFAMVTGQGYQRGSFRWNEIIRDPNTGWYDSLPADLQQALPFKVGSPCFSQIPADVILCPNAEHHSMTDSSGHFNAVGSNFCSGTFDARGKYKLHSHGYPIGTDMPWKEAFERMLDALEVSDGGGVTLNHPKWSRLPHSHLLDLLDFDPRVLGIEIWNHTAEMLNGKGWSLDEWDAILATGRRCWGLAVSDHAHNSDPGFMGRNVLLVNNDTDPQDLPAACLRAYRNGDYYCALNGDLEFRRIELDAGSIHVEVSEPCRLRIVTARGVVHEQSGTKCTWKLPIEAAALQQHVYLRVEADGVDNQERLFSQPFRLT